MPRTETAIARELASMRKSFARLARSFASLGPILAAEPMPVLVNRDGRPRKTPRLTADRRAALKLQGEYMGTMRGLPAAKRARVKLVRAEKGITAAIAEARRMVR